MDGTAGGDDLVGPLSPEPGVIETDLEAELILLDPSTQEMFSLNRTGRLVWQALPADSVDAVLESVLPELQVDEARGAADVRALLDELVETGLVRVGGRD